MAFNWEHAGSSLAVLPLDDCGRKSKNMPLLHGHTDTVTDLHFSPFHDGLLATGSQDCLVSFLLIFLLSLEFLLFFHILSSFQWKLSTLFQLWKLKKKCNRKYFFSPLRSKFGTFQKKVWNNHWPIQNVSLHINSVALKPLDSIRPLIICCIQLPPAISIYGIWPRKKRCSAVMSIRM